MIKPRGIPKASGLLDAYLPENPVEGNLRWSFPWRSMNEISPGNEAAGNETGSGGV